MMLSVIIPTCGRPAQLTRCLSALAQGSSSLGAQSYEVIVSDDGDGLGTPELLSQEFSHVRWTKGPLRGPAANRNHGARQAQGDWLVFLDDDCEPAPGWLEEFAIAVAGDAIDVVEGRTICPNPVDHPFYERVENLRGDVFWSCNLAVRRTVFERLGGFDEDFTDPGGEDMELAWRIRQAGLRCRFVWGAVVYHPSRRLSWRRWWWRTFLIRWILLYRLKTGQAPALQAHPARVCWSVVWLYLLDQARSTYHLLTRGELGFWRSRSFLQCWRWLTVPLVVPYLLCWEFRFRQMLLRRPRPERGVS